VWLSSRIIHADAKDARIIVRYGRFGHEQNMPGVVVFLNFRESPCDDVSPACITQEIDPMPAAS
jgi:hypothetical protein